MDDQFFNFFGARCRPDVFGIDSPYDYDPVWAKCVEVGVMPTFHAGTRGAAFRTSPTFERFGGQQLAERLERSSTFANPGNVATDNIKDLDDFSACQIERTEDIRELFTRNFYFGCEADDPINAWAFHAKTNPYDARIKTLLGSDIGHFDVVNMNEVLEEADELVDDGLITIQDFREFVFTNPLHFWADVPSHSTRRNRESHTRWSFGQPQPAVCCSLIMK